MSRRLTIRCDEVSPLLGRRSVLAGLATFITLVPLAGARTQSLTRLADLIGRDGQASELARSMVGRTILVRGYLAPSLDGVEFSLSEASAGACQLCGNSHDPGATITIRTNSPASALPAFELVQAQGRLLITETSVVSLADVQVQSL